MKNTIKSIEILKSYVLNLERIDPKKDHDIINKKINDLIEIVKKESIKTNKRIKE